jgi:hypothetical protein
VRGLHIRCFVTSVKKVEKQCLLHTPTGSALLTAQYVMRQFIYGRSGPKHDVVDQTVASYLKTLAVTTVHSVAGEWGRMWKEAVVT